MAALPAAVAPWSRMVSARSAPVTEIARRPSTMAAEPSAPSQVSMALVTSWTVPPAPPSRARTVVERTSLPLASNRASVVSSVPAKVTVWVAGSVKARVPVISVMPGKGTPRLWTWLTASRSSAASSSIWFCRLGRMVSRISTSPASSPERSELVMSFWAIAAPT